MAELILHPDAQREYQFAIAWYRQRSLPAAKRFVAAVDRMIATITAHPNRFAWFVKPYREAVLRRHPYSVIYRVEPSQDILVLAIAHASREPGYWQDRT